MLLCAALALAPAPAIVLQQARAQAPASPVLPEQGGAFVEEFQLKVAPPVQSGGPAPPPSPGDPVLISIDANDVQRVVLPTLFGNNIGLWTGDQDTLNPALKERLAEVQVPLLRFPGGNLSNKYHWNGVYPPYAVSQGWDNYSEPWALSTAEFLGLCEELGAQPLITVNHGFHEYASTATNGTLAAAVGLALVG